MPSDSIDKTEDMISRYVGSSDGRDYLAEALARTMRRIASEAVIEFRENLHKEFSKIINKSHEDLRSMVKLEERADKFKTDNDDEDLLHSAKVLANANIHILEQYQQNTPADAKANIPIDIISTDPTAKFEQSDRYLKSENHKSRLLSSSDKSKSSVSFQREDTYRLKYKAKLSKERSSPSKDAFIRTPDITYRKPRNRMVVADSEDESDTGSSSVTLSNKRPVRDQKSSSPHTEVKIPRSSKKSEQPNAWKPISLKELQSAAEDIIAHKYPGQSRRRSSRTTVGVETYSDKEIFKRIAGDLGGKEHMLPPK